MKEKLKENTIELKEKLKENTLELKDKTIELKEKLKEKVKEQVSVVESDISKLSNEINNLRNKIKWENIVRKFISDTSDPNINSGKEKGDNDDENYADSKNKKLYSRKIKLLLLGDSLVCGVGCEGDSLSKSPVLPTILAKALSIAMHADVEWHSAGIIGAAVSDIRSSLVPKIKDEFFGKLASSSNNDIELIVVVICGLNDWKTCIEKFPSFYGPHGFRIELGKLIAEIKELSAAEGTKSCKIFLPALPMTVGESDPNYALRAVPLRYLFNFICSIWDNQKISVAIDNDSTTYIGYPSTEALYATPGQGVVAKDGIHPSSKAYKWWALHIAEQILETDAS